MCSRCSPSECVQITQFYLFMCLLILHSCASQVNPKPYRQSDKVAPATVGWEILYHFFAGFLLSTLHHLTVIPMASLCIIAEKMNQKEGHDWRMSNRWVDLKNVNCSTIAKKEATTKERTNCNHIFLHLHCKIMILIVKSWYLTNLKF